VGSSDLEEEERAAGEGLAPWFKSALARNLARYNKLFEGAPRGRWQRGWLGRRVGSAPRRARAQHVRRGALGMWCGGRGAGLRWRPVLATDSRACGPPGGEGGQRGPLRVWRWGMRGRGCVLGGMELAPSPPTLTLLTQ
jgi:hypothetical protein